MNIIIPMAGRGTRMRPHSISTPKPLIPIAGKPMVHRIVEDIVKTCQEPIEHIGFVCGRFGEEAEKDLIAVAAQFGAKGVIFYQDTPLGTADAILKAKTLLDGHVFIAFADTLFDAQFKIDTNKDSIIWTQKIDDPSAFGVVVLNDNGTVNRFEEKPKEYVSDLAIIGVYYFKDGKNLCNELQYLIDNNVLHKGEYQLTDAMENMRKKGLSFYTDQVTEWLDCGNKDATIFTMSRIVALKQNVEELISKKSIVVNSTIIEPCFIADGVYIENSVIGPNVSVEKDSVVKDSVVKNSIIRNNAQLNNAILNQSMIGCSAVYNGSCETISIGDYSTKD
jgi:glucose-1-phosphate thymidylyltransferase